MLRTFALILGALLLLALLAWLAFPVIMAWTMSQAGKQQPPTEAHQSPPPSERTTEADTTLGLPAPDSSDIKNDNSNTE